MGRVSILRSTRSRWETRGNTGREDEESWKSGENDLISMEWLIPYWTCSNPTLRLPQRERKTKHNVKNKQRSKKSRCAQTRTFFINVERDAIVDER